MLANFFKTGLRIFLRDKLHSTINIFGLSVGLAGLALMLLYIQHEQTYEAFLPDAGKIWRIDTAENYVGRAPIHVAGIPAPARAHLERDFRVIEDATRSTFKDIQVHRDTVRYAERLLLADANYFDFLKMPLVEGDSSGALQGINSVVLSRSTAKKYFGNETALGETITLLLPEAMPLVVTGIMADLPGNSHLQYDMVAPLNRRFFPEASWAMDHWGNPIFATYLRLKDGTDPKSLEHEFPTFVDRHFPASLAGTIKMAPHDFFQFSMTRFTDIHFEGAPLFTMKPKGDKAVLMASFAVAVLIMLVASINFINISVSKSAARAREIAVRRIVGAERRHLMLQFLIESALTVAVSLVLALALAEAVLPQFGAFLGLDLELRYFSDPAVGVSAGLLFLTLTIGVGVYPAFILTRSGSGQIWTAHTMRQPGSSWLQQTLAIFQFAISSGLIIAIIVIANQISFLASKNLGFAKEDILLLRDAADRIPAGELQNFMGRLSDLPGVLSTANSEYVPTDASEGNISLTPAGSKEPTIVGFQNVGVNFFNVYGIKPLVGRLFDNNRDLSVSVDGALKSGQSIMMNALAAKRFGFSSGADAIGKSITSKNGGQVWTIVGIVPNIHFRSLHHELRDEVYFLDPESKHVSVKYNPDKILLVMGGIEQLWNRSVPGRPAKIEFLADTIAKLYAPEKKQQDILAVFALFAALISMLGLYGLATHSISRRAKEVAIRKIFGANMVSIQKLMLWRFTWPIVIGNLLAWPITAYIMQDWLWGFTFRNDLSIMPFLLAGFVTVSLGALTVWRKVFLVSRASPLDPLRQI